MKKKHSHQDNVETISLNQLHQFHHVKAAGHYVYVCKCV